MGDLYNPYKEYTKWLYDANNLYNYTVAIINILEDMTVSVKATLILLKTKADSLNRQAINTAELIEADSYGTLIANRNTMNKAFNDLLELVIKVELSGFIIKE